MIPTKTHRNDNQSINQAINPFLANPLPFDYRLRQKEAELKQRSDGLENLLRRTEMKIQMPLNVFLMSQQGNFVLECKFKCFHVFLMDNLVSSQIE